MTTAAPASAAPSSALLPALALGATILTWATAFPAIRLALREVEPLALASLRFAIGALLALLWLAFRRPPRMPARDIAFAALCGLIATAGYGIFLNLGAQTVSAGAASFLVKIESLVMAGLAVLLLKEHFNGWAWLGALIAMGGVGAIASHQPGGISFGAGAILVLAAACCSATGFVLQRPLIGRYGALSITAIGLIAAALALSPWLPGGVEQALAAPPATIGWILFLGLLPTTVGMLCWNIALGHFGAARAGTALYLVAPLATLLAWPLSGETPAWSTLAGGAAVLGGVLLVNTLGKR
ncbi:MAG TPA: DMT family transporter [Kiloniellales bacterium]|nr:DMT family transporter [Kiloniellales bacterium]